MFKILNRFKKKQKVKPVVKEYLKTEFKRFFEGTIIAGDEYDKPIISIAVIKFGITDIDVNYDTEPGKNGETVDVINMFITLERPGILIGRAGRVINRLERYLNGPQHQPQLDRKVNVKIVESKLWAKESQ
jgi:hypothetical protein